MQTFLPTPDFATSARWLDRRRLGKQRLEALQILRGLRGYTQGWNNHPAVQQWRGYEAALAQYGLACCAEWTARGYIDNMAPLLRALQSTLEPAVLPPWLGDARLHASHRAALLAKDYAWYSQFGWSESPGIDYYWPSKDPIYATTP